MIRSPKTPKKEAPKHDDTGDSTLSDTSENQPPVEDSSFLDQPADTSENSEKPGRRERHFKRWPLKHLPIYRRRDLYLILLVVVLLTAVCLAGWFKFVNNKPTTQGAVVIKRTAVKKEPPKPTTVASPLSGVQVTPEQAAMPVTGVMIENSPDARPQSGLNSAGVVYEAIAEGGITRFLALFQDTNPDYVGPIRSARPYYLDWILPFQGSLAHVGGSPDALAQIKSLNVRNLDQFANSGSYTRITARYAPHNVYTSIDRLVALEKSKGYGTSTYTSFARKAPAPAATPTAKTIDFNISGYLYNPTYTYDATTNTYKRSEGGQIHKDEKSGNQLAPTVVIALVMTNTLNGDGIHNIYATTGSGHMYVFQDGIVAEGTWTKADRTSQFKFNNLGGEELKLNAGQTWISIVGSQGAVTYKP